MYKEFGISEDLENVSIEVEKEIKEQFERVDRMHTPIWGGFLCYKLFNN